MARTFSLALAATAIALTPACAQEQVGTADKEAIEKIVAEYIIENPQIIEDALIALSEQRAAEEAEQARAAIAENRDALINNAGDFSIGPADAPVTVVEFFDYRCGFCKRSAEWATELPEKYDNQVRVVFKEFPILSTESEKAALAAIAAGEVHGLAHITGGGLTENLPRVLPKHLGASIDLNSITLSPVFRWLKEAGGVEESEMLRTFNCGTGMVLVVAADRAEAITEVLTSAGERVSNIGMVTSGDGEVSYSGKLDWAAA